MAVLFHVTAHATINDAGILNNQGVELFERGYVVAATEKFNQALDMDPDNPMVHANLGYAYQALNNHEEAVRAFKTALSYDPTNLEVHNNLGVSMYNLGMTGRAVEEWEFVLANDPTNAPAAANLAMVRNPAVADRIAFEARDAMMSPVQRELKLNRTLTDMFEKGKQAFKEARYDDCIDYLTDVLESKPTSKFSHYYIGMSYAYLNMNTSAMKHLREYLILENYPPESTEAYNKAMNVFNQLKGGDELSPRLKKTDPMAPAIFNQGKQAYLAGDYFKAINILNDVYNKKPDSYETNYYLGMSYKQTGDTNRAVFHLTKCLLAGPEYRSKEEALEVARIIKQISG